MRRRDLLIGSSMVGAAWSLAQDTPPQEGNKPSKPSMPGIYDDIQFDKHGLIVQRNGDGGDTAQREGMYWLAKYYRKTQFNQPGQPKLAVFQPWRTDTDFVEILDQLDAKDANGKFTGRYRRHPHQKTAENDWTDPEKMSRDQMIPLIAAMGAWDMKDRLKRLRDNMETKAWIFKTINKDLMLLYEEFMKRALNDAVAETIDKTIADCSLSARLRCTKDADDTGDDLNQMVQLLLPELKQNKDYFPAIRERYVKLRPVNYGIYLTAYYKKWGKKAVSTDVLKKRMEDGIAAGWAPDVSNVFGAIKWYCRVESGGNPGLATMYKPIYDRVFAGPVPPTKSQFKAVDDVHECTILNMVPESFCHQES